MKKSLFPKSISDSITLGGKRIIIGPKSVAHTKGASDKKSKIFNSIAILDKYLTKGFGGKQCPTFNPDCPTCRAHQLMGLLEWYDQLINESNP